MIGDAASVDLKAIGDLLLARVRKIAAHRFTVTLACLAALRSALDALSPDERSQLLEYAIDALRADMPPWDTAGRAGRKG